MALLTCIKMSRTRIDEMPRRSDMPAFRIGSQQHFDREKIDQWMKAHATGNVGSDHKDKKQ